MAENVSEILIKGARVIVTGRLEQRSWETPDGDKRSKVEVIADEIGPSLRWATAQITKNERRGPAGRRARGGGAPAAGPTVPTEPVPAGTIGRGALLMARNNDRRTRRTRVPKDNGRRIKKKRVLFCKDRVEWVDYKDMNLLRKYM